MLNRPLLHWTLELLARHGVTEVVINLHHLPAHGAARGRATAGRSACAVRYSRERSILGTGGRAAPAPALLRRRAVPARERRRRLRLRPHAAAGPAPRARGARATLALMPNPDPRRYGAGRDGRRTAASARWRACRGRRAAGPSLFTGVHVLDPALLDRLPRGPSDIVRDLYAPLLAEGERVAGRARARARGTISAAPSLYLASQLAAARRASSAAGARLARRPRGARRIRARGSRAPWSGRAR